MRYIVTINNKNYEVEVEKGQASVVKTTEAAVPNITVVSQAPAQAPAQAPTPAPAPVPAAVIAKGEPLKAPMPGTIISIKVNNGQKVKKGDVILVLEAMKMENEITAPIDGVVVQINVGKGSAVSTGDILAVIE